MLKHVEETREGPHAYCVQVGGTVDGAMTRDPVGYGNYDQGWENNLYLRLENIGDEAVTNPRVSINGKRRWHSIQAVLDSILTEGMDEAEKARAIWEFARRHRYHSTTADDEVKDTVKMLNVYGYTLCWDEAYTVSNLWQAAGLKIRRGVPHGHCTTEVFFDGDYHLLDSDEHLLYLLRDNQTIASEEDLARDHDLVKRGHAYGILHQESRKTGEGAASLFLHTGPRSGGRPRVGGHCMDLVLRPGEALIWAWEDRSRYHGYGTRPPRLANGRLEYAPRLHEDFARWAESALNLRSVEGGLCPQDPQAESLLCYAIAAPYAMVGGQVRLRTEGDCAVEISRDNRIWQPLHREKDAHPLDPHFPPDGRPCYAFSLRLRGRGWSLLSLDLEADLQMAPLSLPALDLGANQVLYTDASARRRVRLTHAWRERADWHPPAAPAAPLFPADGARVEGTQLSFSWEPVAHAADYHFELSPRADMRYALSPVFEKLVSRTPSAGRAQWRVPEEGLLNPGQTYYWRVRARDANLVWGPWSPVWRFVPQAPGVPLDLKLESDRESGTMTLRWSANPQGRPPCRYEVHASDERGFSASRDPYPVHLGRDQGEQIFPANLIALTEDTALQVVGPHIPAGSGNRAFYRVVAVDEQGNRSAPSDLAAAERPFIYSQPPPRASAGQLYTYALKVLRSMGDLRSQSQGAQRYFSAFRDGDQLRFLLDEGPDFIELDERTGLLQARPAHQHLGLHTVTLRVDNGQGGTAVQGFDLEVVEP